MSNTETNLDIVCAKCGKDLNNQTSLIGTSFPQAHLLEITPCNHCLKKTRSLYEKDLIKAFKNGELSACRKSKRK